MGHFPCFGCLSVFVNWIWLRRYLQVCEKHESKWKSWQWIYFFMVNIVTSFCYFYSVSHSFFFFFNFICFSFFFSSLFRVKLEYLLLFQLELPIALIFHYFQTAFVLDFYLTRFLIQLYGKVLKLLLLIWVFIEIFDHFLKNIVFWFTLNN